MIHDLANINTIDERMRSLTNKYISKAKLIDHEIETIITANNIVSSSPTKASQI